MPSTLRCRFCGRELERIEISDFILRCLPEDVAAKFREEGAFEVCGCPQSLMSVEQDDADERDDGGLADRRVWEKSGIPIGYFDAVLDDEVAGKVSESLDILRSGKGVYMHGDTGVGKTTAAAEIAKRFSSRGKVVRFSDIETIERAYADSLDFDSPETAQSIIDRFVRADLVVIDDIGSEAMTAMATKVLRAVVSGREANARLTIFTSNLSRVELAARLADGTSDVMARRLMSRISGMTEVIEFAGPDRRIAQ